MRNLAIITSIALSGNLLAQDYSISNWYNDYQACMVQTYDDMNSDHVNICTPQLKARGMGGTMFVDYDQTSHVNLSGGWAGLMDAADDGMEMANHTQNHADLTAMKGNATGLESEISTFRDFLNTNITNQDCNTFAYPYGNGNLDWQVTDEIKKHHIGARDAGLPGTGSWGWNPNWLYDFGANEDDYFQIPTIAEHFLKPKIQAEVDNLLQYGGLMTVMWHAIVSSDHEQYLDNILSACNGKVWHSNFQDAVK
jgi:peptidoglycan/xylan/chitin deacetylase (PgdA/CDA1 family)